MTSTDIVWKETRIDSGRYECAVTRDGDKGMMTITLLGSINHLLHEEQVKVDRADTDLWRKRCESVISNPDLRTIDR